VSDDIKLVTDKDDETGLYYFVVKENSKVLHFRPGFCSRSEAERVGDLWIREHLGGEPLIG
jgi:hypothetical protein